MMTVLELKEILDRLKLTQVEAAKLLGVAPRTLRRWLEGEDIPGPAQQALRAWMKLAARRLAWRPDSVSIVDDDQQQIDLQRAHAIELDEVLTKVERRGGPRMTWTVDKEHCYANFGPMEISYYRLHNGSFSPGFYRRSDQLPDRQADWEFIEDALYCIAMALRYSVEEIGHDTFLVRCPEGDYKVVGSCTARFEKLGEDERRHALEKAKRFGKRAVIDSHCL
jgi:transcriptional regulator with XRE-family HTH domain